MLNSYHLDLNHLTFAAAVLACMPFLVGCHAAPTNAPTAPASETDFVDLAPGRTLRITTPILKGGGYVMKIQNQAASGSSTEVKAQDLIGFEISHYSIARGAGGRVRLQFQSAETSLDGKSAQVKKAPALPFQLPGGSRFIRLIYFVRSSQADHNMAIAAATKMGELTSFTAALKQNPQVCAQAGPVVCSWIPAGVAVRPE